MPTVTWTWLELMARFSLPFIFMKLWSSFIIFKYIQFGDRQYIQHEHTAAPVLMQGLHHRVSQSFCHQEEIFPASLRIFNGRHMDGRSGNILESSEITTLTVIWRIILQQIWELPQVWSWQCFNSTAYSPPDSAVMSPSSDFLFFSYALER